MKKKIKWICERLKSGRFKQLWIQTVWIYSYVRMYWKEIVFYTGTGLLGTVIGLVSSLLSKDLVDLITGHQASRLVMTFVWYIRIFSRKYLCDTVVKLSVEHDFVKGRSGNESRYFSENADNAVRTVNGISYRRFADTLEQ